MRCEEADKMMSRRLDGCLCEMAQLELDDHLRMCADCRARWQKLEVVDRLFHTAPMAMAPADLHVRVMTRLERHRHRTSRAIIGSLGLALGTIALASLVLPGAIRSLLEPLGIIPALVSAGPVMVSRGISFLNTLGRALVISIGPLTLPLTLLFLACTLMALALNGLWIRVLRCA